MSSAVSDEPTDNHVTLAMIFPTDDNLKVGTVEALQGWTLVGALTGAVGVFGAVMFASFTMLRTSLVAELDARLKITDAKIDSLARITDVRLKSLEADMHLVKGHLIGEKSA